MVRIEALYGVSHGAEAVSLLGDRKPLSREPSNEIQQMLHELPQGTSVGIEYHPDVPLVGTTRGAYFPSESYYYWQQIEKICKQNKLSIVYLDDISLLYKYSKHIERASDLEYLADEVEDREYRKREEGYVDEDEWYTTEENLISIHDRRREAYCHRIIGQYILEVKREESMLSHVVSTHPQVVILGQGHSDMLILDSSIRDRYNLSIEAYHSEPPDSAEPLRRTLLTRRYTAVTIGRIDSSRIPEYIGYYKYNEDSAPEEGLFEMYIDATGPFQGQVVDCLGDAQFSNGTVTADHVSFRKIYKRNGVILSKPIVYKGEKRGDEYQGAWIGEKSSGTFVLRAYKPGVQLFEPLVLE